MQIDGYWMMAWSTDAGAAALTVPFTPGLTVFANVSLSLYAAYIIPPETVNYPDHQAYAYIKSWTVYQPDGSQVTVLPENIFENTVAVENCGSIEFRLSVWQALAKVQISIFIV
jgi:hypothetical protein